MSYLSEARTVFRNALLLQSSRLNVKHYSKSVTPKDDEIYNEDEVGKLSVTDLLPDDVDEKVREKEIQRMRNKSRLNRTHRNFLFNQPKPLEEYQWDKTVAFSRKQFARYGYASGVDPRLCFHTQEELADKQEYERVAYPFTVQEMSEQAKTEKAAKQAAIKEREMKIAQNMSKLGKWMEDLNTRISKKEEEARVARTKREQLLEDMRQEFGFKIDFKDPRFKAMMEKKELEQKKAKKMAKKKKREEQLMEKLKEEAEKTTPSTKSTDKEADAQNKQKEEKKSKKDNDSDSDSDDENDKKDKKK